MESAQREVVGVLLAYIRSVGLISDAAYSGAMDLVHSAIHFPEFFRYPVCLSEEAGGCECAQDTQ